MGISAALPVASVMRCRVKPVSYTHLAALREVKMSYAIVFSSKTGNTALLAQTLQEQLPQADCCLLYTSRCV